MTIQNNREVQEMVNGKEIIQWRMREMVNDGTETKVEGEGNGE